MTGLMYPKTPPKKRRKKHSPSILRQDDGTCYLCVLLNGDYRQHKHREEHHIFGGANRKWSEAYGLKVRLCMEHHRTGPEAAHQNAQTADRLHRIGQQAFEKAYPTLSFIRIFGKNYL